MSSVLVVDDDRNILSALNRLLRSPRYQLDLVSSPEEALELCDKHAYTVIISDQKMPAIYGTELMRRIADTQKQAMKIILSGYSDFTEIVEAFNQDIIDQFVAKPWDDQSLLEMVEQALAADEVDVKVESEVSTPDNELQQFHDLFTADKSMLSLFSKMRKAAKAAAPIFIFGESGTGKELTAKAIHQESHHNTGPFVAVNCANFSEQLMESQLFGHKKGAFTGAVSDQDGILSAADGGTLFLDEITSLSESLQAKLLRTLQEMEYTPIGSTEVISFQANVITASNLHLSEAVARGTFREDLYYRLCVIPIHLTPLRDRGGDATKLFWYYLNKLSGVDDYSADDEVINYIASYDWPGNIRELLNCCQYISAMVDAKHITFDDLPVTLLDKKQNEVEESVEKESKELSEESILSALEQTKNKTAAAKLLGVSRMTLWRRMKDFGVE